MNLTTSQVIIGYFAYYINPLYILLLCLRIFNVRYYTIHGDRETISPIIQKLMPYIKTMAMKQMNGRELNVGLFWSTKAVGLIDIHHEETIYIVTTNTFYKFITKPEECTMVQLPIVAHVPINKIDMYIRSGQFKNMYYIKHQLDLTHISPIGQQEEVLQGVISVYNKMGRATVFIHGASCTGKSKIGYLLAKQMGGNYCHTFNPSEPGDTLSRLLMEISKSEKPLVLVMEEVDGIITRLHKNTIQQNREIPTVIHDKSSWCTFLDDMFIYKNIILIMTSNVSKETIDIMDPAYLRPGRIHACYSMNTVLNIY
jgi:hypothetical protein